MIKMDESNVMTRNLELIAQRGSQGSGQSDTLSTMVLPEYLLPYRLPTTAGATRPSACVLQSYFYSVAPVPAAAS